MKLTLYTFILALLTFLISCQKPVEYIIPTNPEGIFAEALKDGLTEDEARETSILMVDSVYRNNVGRRIPQILVRNLENKKLHLQDAIKEKSVIISGDIYCGFGMECITNTFPETYKQLQKAGSTLPIICLIRKTANDYEDSTRFNEVVKELSSVYENLLIINEEDAFKINAISGSTRYYVNKDNLVTDVKFGNCTAENIFNELKLHANTP